MNFRLTLVLLVLLVVVGGLFLWAVNRPADVKPSAASAHLVISPAPEGIASVTLLRGETPQVAFARTGDKWTMTAPVHAAAEPWQIDSVATQLSGLSYKDKFTAEANGPRSLDATGLAKPRFSIRFADKAKKEYTLLIGKRTPGGSTYVRLASDPTNTIFTLDTNPVERLDKDPSEFRAKELVDLPMGESPAAITLAHTGRKVLLAKSGGKWLIQQPITTRANGSVVDEIVNQLRQLRAEQFVGLTRQDNATGLAKPSLTISVTLAAASTGASATAPATAPTTASAATFTLDFGNYSDLTRNTLYAAVNGSDEAVLVSATAFSKMNKELNDLRDPAVTPAPVTEATAIEIQNNESSDASPHRLILTKTNEKWQINGERFQGDPSTIGDFLNAIRDLRVNKYLDAAGDLGAIGLNPPQRIIALQLPGQAQRETILIGKPQTAEPLTPVQRQGEPTVYLVHTNDLARLAPTLADLRDRAIATWKANQIHEIELSGPAVKFPVTLTREESKWKVTWNGQTTEADETKIGPLLVDFDALTAQKWLPDKNLPSATPAAIVRLMVSKTPAAETQPTTQAAAIMGPSLPETLEVRLYQSADHKNWSATPPTGTAAPTTAAVTSAPAVTWLFQPTAALVEHVTTTDYRPTAATQAATQASTQAATQATTNE